MTDLLAGLNEVNTTDLQENDSVGFSYTPSGVYPALINLAYVDVDTKGRRILQLEFKTKEGDKERTRFHRQYFSYENGAFTKDGKTHFGLKIVEGLVQLAAGTSLNNVERENKIIEVATREGKVKEEKLVLTGLRNQKIKVGLIHEITNKRGQDATGAWVDTNEKKEENRIDKFFHFEDETTSGEFAKKQPAKFIETWKKTYVTGEPVNKFKPVQGNGASQGSPTGNTANNVDPFA